MLRTIAAAAQQAQNIRIGRVTLVGFNRATGEQLLMTLILCVGLFLFSRLLKFIVHHAFNELKHKRAVFWVRQVINVVLALAFLVGILSIWFRGGTQLTTFLGLVTAGIAFALQQVITALAGYIVILRGKNFTVGDRIVMGGVRGDVIALGFIQTTIMEMGQPPAVQSTDPAMWVKARQYTGRIVTISNAKIFSEPVYNYTRDFPYIWEELSLPISYKDDREKAEQILLEAARKHSIDPKDLDPAAVNEMRRRYAMEVPEMAPKVYLRLTDNWVELTVRFLTSEHGVRDAKDQMSRGIIAALDRAGIGIASGTYEVVGMPPLRIIQQQEEPRTGVARDPNVATTSLENGPGQMAK
jgi:small-conductance mechanosensitive channel